MAVITFLVLWMMEEDSFLETKCQRVWQTCRRSVEKGLLGGINARVLDTGAKN